MTLLITNILIWLKYNFWWLLIFIVLIIVFIAIVRLIMQGQVSTKTPIEDEKINEFVDCYGGIENIKSIELEGSRLKANLKNLDKVKLEKFKELGATGIFISGKNVKMVLPYDMEKLVEKINEDKYGGKV